MNTKGIREAELLREMAIKLMRLSAHMMDTADKVEIVGTSEDKLYSEMYNRTRMAYLNDLIAAKYTKILHDDFLDRIRNDKEL